MERKLQRWGAQLDALTDEPSAAGAAMRADELKVVAELRTKKDIVETRLNELRATESEHWDTIKAGVDSACGELEATFAKLRR